MPITRIQWSDEENHLVANRWVELCIREHIDPMRPPGVTRLAAEAQQVLPPSRWRPENSIKGLTSVTRLMAFVRVAVDERKRKATKVETHPTTTSKPTHFVQPSKIQVPPPTHKEEVNLSNLESIVTAFGKSIASILVTEITNAIRHTFHEEFPKLHTRALAVSKVLPRILVCGPLPKQHPGLEESVSGVADLKFVSSEESPKLVNLRGQNCSAVIVWANFVSHAHQQSARSVFGNDRLIIVSGGLETLKAKIEETALKVQIPDQAH